MNPSSFFRACVLSLGALLFSLAPAVLADVTASYTTGNEVPVTANGFTAAGSTVNFTLNYAPAPGTSLMVVKNTGPGFIQGTFNGLPNGATVDLAYNSKTYRFIAWYYGGSGNDLVLLWSYTSLGAWGSNANRALGDGTTTDRFAPVPVNQTGVLANKTIVQVARGSRHSLALCSDGTVAAWGANNNGQLGDNTNTNRAVPVAVNAVSGVSALNGKSVVAVAAGDRHSLALCSDGTVVAWGFNQSGALGDNTQTQRLVPTAVNVANGTSALFGKTVTAISAGWDFSLALCSDGTVAAWGINFSGQLGDNSLTQRLAPTPVNTASGVSALFGKTVTGISAGNEFCLALCSDGTLASWGTNSDGQLGDASQTDRNVPVTVNVANGVSALFGKTVTGIAAGASHSLALCSDGTVAAWGYNDFGQLGDNSQTGRIVPVLVNTTNGTSALSGKTVTGVAAGVFYSLALCSDGTAAAWGSNDSGQLGDNTGVDRKVPVAVDVAAGSLLLAGGRAVSLAQCGAGADHSLAVFGTPPPSEIAVFADAGTTPGTELQDNIGVVTLANADVGSNSTQTFTIKNTGIGDLTGLAVTITGTDAALFTSSTLGSTALAANQTTSFTVTFAPLAPGMRSATVNIASNDGDENPFRINLIAYSGATFTATYTTGTEIPLTGDGFVATSNTLNFVLNYAPTPGTNLMVVKNTGRGFIQGIFNGLPNGATVNMTYNGVTYPFVAWYYGGSGNDLVLLWPYTNLAAWGNNAQGQIGDGSTISRSAPVPVDQSGVLSGKTLVQVVRGSSHTMALCTDGTVAAWGRNNAGQLGDGTTTDRAVPVVVNAASGVSALFGKTVVALAAGAQHSLALCSDGTVAAWGGNGSGQLGDNLQEAFSNVPVAVNAANGVSALFGKTVVGLTAGAQHSLALCSDGTVAAWGANESGQIGDNTLTDRSVPVAVNAEAGQSALFGATVVSLKAAPRGALALCADGTLVAWGDNSSGQLGDHSSTNRQTPVAVNADSGVSALSGKAVVSMAAGEEHSLALCADGTVASWGSGEFGQLGDNSVNSFSDVPAAVNVANGTSALFGKTVVGIAAGSFQSVALCADGTVAAWGKNDSGQLGDATTTNRIAPVAVNRVRGSSVLAGKVVSQLAGEGGGAGHTLVQYGTPTPPEIAVFNGASTAPANERKDNIGAFGFADILLGAGIGEPQTFTIQNTGIANLAGLALTLTGANAGEFTLGSLGSTVLAPGQTTTFAVTFAPTAVGTRNAVVNIASNDADEDPFRINVTGNAGTAMTATYTTGAEIPLTSDGFTAAANTMTFTLNYAPTLGTNLTVVKNTSTSFIRGSFTNLPNGAPVDLTFNGATYHFSAWYYGGDGNDLVLLWRNTGLTGWGYNGYGQLGDNTTTNRLTPAAVDQSGVLAGKTIVRVERGLTHSLALCADGTVAAWGGNATGELGDGTLNDRATPVLVKADSGASALFGKTVVAIAAGAHSLALCSDGTVAIWGGNSGSLVPLAVDKSALAGRSVVAIASGLLHGLALCSDGSVWAWGQNSNGQLGDNTLTNRSAMVAVNAVSGSSFLFGKTVARIAAGERHSLALCTDGTLAAWGANSSGALGDNSQIQRNTPVAVIKTGALAGKTVVALAAGSLHSMALCSDGKVVAWGGNNRGQVGDNATVNRLAPVAVNTASGTSALFGKTVVAISAGLSHSLALSSDGAVAAWGANANGQLGDATTTERHAPVAVNTASGSSALASRKARSLGGSGANADHAFATYAIATNTAPSFALPGPPSPYVVNVPASSGAYSATGFAKSISPGSPDDAGQTVTFAVTPDNPGLFTVQPAIAKDGTLTFTPGALTGSVTVTVIAHDDGGTADGGVDVSAPQTFIINVLPSANADLAGIALSAGALTPAFDPATTAYAAAVDAGVGSLTVTPTVAQENATVQVKANGGSFGSPALSVPLDFGANTITILVTAENGVAMKAYTVVVLRQFGAPSAEDITAVSATLGALIPDTNSPPVIERGMLYARTAVNGNPQLGGAGVTRVQVNVSGAAFAVPAGSLFPSTGYSYRAYAIYSVDVNYSPVLTFTTPAALPKITVLDPGGATLGDNETLAFGNAATGALKTRTLVIRNTGLAPLSGLAASLIGASAEDFTLSALPVTALAPGAGMALTVTFKPTAQANSAATLNIASNDASLPVHHTMLTGTGVASTPAVISVQREAPVAVLTENANVDFGNVAQGTDKVITFTIRNNGTQNLTGLSLAATGANASDFILGAPAANVLSAGDTATFTITLRPGKTGARAALIRIASSDAATPYFRINVTGTGTAPEIAVTDGLTSVKDGGAAINFGTTVAVGSQVVRTFNISNIGTADLVLSSIVVDGANAVEFAAGAPGLTTLAPGAATSLDVTFKPRTFGARAAVLHILSNDADESPFDIKLAATAIGPEISVVQPPSTAQLSSHVSVIDFGAAVSGAAVTRTFTIKNLGNASLTSISITTDQPQFTISASPAAAATLAGGASTTFAVNFTPDSVAAFNGHVVIASNDFDEASFSIAVQGAGVTSIAPAFTGQPQSQIVALGQPATFTATVDSAVPFTRQWRKGTTTFANIAGATAASYTIPAVKLTDAAPLYLLRATNTSGGLFTDSTSAALTVVDPKSSSLNLAAGTAATFTLSAAGSSALTYQWFKDGAGLPADTRYVITPGKLVINALREADTGVYTCQVSGPGGSMVGGNNTLTVFSDAPVITPNPLTLPPAIVSGDYSFFIPLDSAHGKATSFTITALPAGLKFNTATGEVYGKATASKAAPYSLTVTAKNAAGTATANASLMVSPLTAEAAGTYVGIIDRGAVNGNLGGRVDLTVTATGSYTGSVTLGAAKSVKFPAGSVNATLGSTLVTGSVTVPRAGLPSVVVDFTLDTQVKRFGQNCTVTIGADSSPFRGWRNVWSAAVPPASYKGYYTFSLDIPAALAVNTDIPQGLGFGSFTVPVKGENVSVTGRTADGDSYTSSAPLGPDGDLAIFAYLPGMGSLVGNPQINLGTGPAYDDNVLSASDLTWSRAAAPANAKAAAAATYPAGFGPLLLTMEGGRYVAPAGSAIVMAKAPGANNASLAFFDAGIGGPPSRADRQLTLTSGATLTIPAAGATLTSLKITTATGVFSGGFTLVDNHPYLSGAAPIKRTVTFQGVIVPTSSGQRGAGYFLLQQLPANVYPAPAVLPILSGGVVIE